MNLKNHFAGDVCAAVKSRGVGKDRAGWRARYECDGNEFRSSYLLKTKTREGEREETEDERSDYTRKSSLARLESCPL